MALSMFLLVAILLLGVGGALVALIVVVAILANKSKKTEQLKQNQSE